VDSAGKLEANRRTLEASFRKPMLDSSKIIYCPIHHYYIVAPCVYCVDDGIEDFSSSRLRKEIARLTSEVEQMPQDLGCLEDMRTKTIEVIEQMKVLLEKIKTDGD
jgi:hypothetical protein